MEEKVAVIGTGVTGLGAAWHLCQNTGYDITVFESEDTAGGHSLSMKVPIEHGQMENVDVGFIVFNKVSILMFELLFWLKLLLAGATVDSGIGISFIPRASKWMTFL